MSIRVLLADDQAMVRAGFRMILGSEPDIEVVGEAENGEQAAAAANRLRPDVVFMDIQMPGVDGLQATRTITQNQQLATRVVILTTFERDEYVFDALRLGASGFLLKDTPPARLLEAIRTVVDAGALLAPSVTRTLIREFAGQTHRSTTPHPNLAQLTDREREVVSLVAQGLTNDEIGERLVVSPATARTHVSRAMIKLGARDRAQLVVFAYQSGLA